MVSTYSDLYNIEPHEDWTKYREFIANVKWKGNFNANMTSSIMDHFKKFSEEMNSISLLYDHVCDYDYNAMDMMLFDLVNRIIHDKNLILETAIQELSPDEFRTALSGNDQAKGDEAALTPANDGFSVEDDAVILPVKPIVAPVKGKPIYELRVGDRLMVFIQPQSDRANYFIDLLNLREDNEIRPTAGEVIDIKAVSGKNNPTDILTLISPGIYGKFTETEKQVKLKLYNPDVDGPLEKRRGGARGRVIGRQPPRVNKRHHRHAGAVHGDSRPFYRADIFNLVTVAVCHRTQRRRNGRGERRVGIPPNQEWFQWKSIRTRNMS